MVLSKLCSGEINKSKAYVLGLTFPLTVTKKIEGKEYLLGRINHNHGMINNEQLFTHYSNIDDMLKEDQMEREIIIKDNKGLSSKRGFTILTEIDSSNYQEIMLDAVKRIQQGPESIKKYFVMGCFDGRASMDNTTGFIAIDVDRNYSKQEVIDKIISNLDIGVNLNQRADNHRKNDQIRIKKTDREKYLNDIGFLSVKRTELLKKNIVKVY